MKTLKELEDELCKALFSPLALTHERHAIQDALLAAERGGIELAISELERLEVWQHAEGGYLVEAYECMSPEDCIPSIRALAQGGE